MKKNTNRNYKEVKIDNNGRWMDGYYRNPLAKAYQYEYALFKTVSDLFAVTECRSMCLDSLKLYFWELGHKRGKEDVQNSEYDRKPEKHLKTQESILAETMTLVRRDVIGHVIFPMMNICAAEVRIIPEKDGSHSFVFSDGIYGFKLHMNVPRKGHPTGIEVENLGSHDVHQASTENIDCSVDKKAA